ncbi:hypothetical protein VD0002_g2450 [Verticillium dahliae]|uniref:Pyridoxamine 5'-phosphate oxidase N-terminal domain-containing protein n=2 Tax=Verticillium dahliae TaxID=27337 RepID=G2WWZ5_VERDV|nr:uncharacterized protein VDAG_02774 [Verticillium dahliae VdLs.17]KAH6707236.1 hypothetical protein EV126DRAFT_333929 [Verticillium dahliae]EGY21250.1 hypothetical protein VDAG_02774 [Verticillium dahliae VdLs.17]PNH30416.1 hypothetical protein BJF96_g6293 [Verticillium dahliae]PNH43004.1 hypothetical protein VD0004_g4419 [Verticillium dahliae]PNH53060.1 hypothetical protein VD0003_g4295 [Verticillium dahliae]
METAPLNYEASAGDTNKQYTATLPQDVIQCLENARFLHLATCTDDVPNVSLMNYTYLPSSPFSAAPIIAMTTNPASRKTTNLLSNPNVSLLVHDWVSHRPPTSARRPSGGSPGPEHRSSLASLLLNINTSAVSSISATINGTARLLDAGSPEERFYREQHLENNTFGSEGFGPASVEAEDGGRGCFVAGEEVRVIVVTIRDVRISDWKGSVRDFVLTTTNEDSAETAVNGVR